LPGRGNPKLCVRLDPLTISRLNELAVLASAARGRPVTVSEVVRQSLYYGMAILGEELDAELRRRVLGVRGGDKGEDS